MKEGEKGIMREELARTSIFRRRLRRTRSLDELRRIACGRFDKLTTGRFDELTAGDAALLVHFVLIESIPRWLSRADYSCFPIAILIVFRACFYANSLLN